MNHEVGVFNLFPVDSNNTNFLLSRQILVMTNTQPFTKSRRIEVVDTLRYFASMAIMLLHNPEYFDFYYSTEYLPGWLKILDVRIWNLN